MRENRALKINLKAAPCSVGTDEQKGNYRLKAKRRVLATGGTDLVEGHVRGGGVAFEVCF